MTWTDNHGEDGLRRKFDVYKPKDGIILGAFGEVVYPDSARVGADGEFIFVLRPEGDAAAVVALETYARQVRHRAPQLASAIEMKMRLIRKENEPS